MSEKGNERAFRPHASGRRLESAIRQALGCLDSLPARRVMSSGRQKHGPLLWRVLLELSLARADEGVAPSFRKHDLSFELKRRSGEDIEVDAKLWGRFCRFLEGHRALLQAAAQKSGVPALAAERAADGGGDPDKTEAVYWLCFDREIKPSHNGPSSEPDVPRQAESQRQPDLLVVLHGLREARRQSRPSTFSSALTVASVAFVLSALGMAVSQPLQPVQDLVSLVQSLRDVLNGTWWVRF